MTKKVWVNLGEAHERLKGLHSCGAVNPDWKAAWGPPPPDPPSDWATRDRRFWVTGTPGQWWRYRHRGVLRTDYRPFGASAQRGRPRKPDKLSNAEKQRRYRQRLRAKRMQEN